MRLACFDDYRPGVVRDGMIHDLTPLLPGWRPEPGFVNAFLASWSRLRPAVDTCLDTLPQMPLDQVTLLAPVPRPGQVLAAPLNFQEHRDEMKGPLTAGPGTARELGFFLKSPGSVSGPLTPVQLPVFPERRIDFEAEVAIVIGTPAENVPPEKALDHVLGYTLVLDMTLRMTETEREERSLRKSFSTFTPMGPWILTSDEVPDPRALTIRAWRNGELRQSASLQDLIVPVEELVSRASRVVRLEAGDVYATGSPAGVGQVQVGDIIAVESPSIGRMELEIARRSW